MAIIQEALLLVKDEIQNDPASIGYLGKSSWEQASLLNSPHSQNPPVFLTSPVEVKTIIGYVLGHDLFERIIGVAQTQAASGHADAFRALQFLQYGGGTVDLQSPIVIATFNGLVTAGLLSADNWAAIQQMQYVVEMKKSRADIIGVGHIEPGDIEVALTI